jgi:hypothetical protein
MQSASELGVTPGLACFPAGHVNAPATQLEDPTAVAYVFGGHGKQADVEEPPSFGLYRFNGHGLQALLPATSW